MQINWQKHYITSIFHFAFFKSSMLTIYLFTIVCWWKESLGAEIVTASSITRVGIWPRRPSRHLTSQWLWGQAMTFRSTATITSAASKNSATPRSKCPKTWPCSRLSTVTPTLSTLKARPISHTRPILRETRLMVKLKSLCTLLSVVWKWTTKKS